MKAALVLLLLAIPAVAATSHLEAPPGLAVEPGNQVLRIHWRAVADADAVGYYVYVYDEDGLIAADATRNWTLDVPGTEAVYRGAVNERTYAVLVAAHDASGQAGPVSAPVGATPRLARDPTYLAVGLIVLWAGLWAYVLLLARAERSLRERVDRLLIEKRRHGDRP